MIAVTNCRSCYLSWRTLKLMKKWVTHVLVARLVSGHTHFTSGMWSINWPEGYFVFKYTLCVNLGSSWQRCWRQQFRGHGSNSSWYSIENWVQCSCPRPRYTRQATGRLLVVVMTIVSLTSVSRPTPPPHTHIPSSLSRTLSWPYKPVIVSDSFS